MILKKSFTQVVLLLISLFRERKIMKIQRFTMLEMLIVVTILLFLTIGIFTVGGNLISQYKIKQARMQILTISNALVAYNGATGNYPPDYTSSSYDENDNGSLGKTWSWSGVLYRTEAIARKYYGTNADKGGAPKALLKVRYRWSTYYVIQNFSWGSDLGGTFPDEKGGFICQNKKLVKRNPGCLGFLGKKWQTSSKGIRFSSPSVIDASGNGSYRCGIDRHFSCGDDPTDATFSCGWHNRKNDSWEGGYGSEESSKALYDYLCRPMKGRVRGGVPVSSKFNNAKPFLDMTANYLTRAGRPPDVEECTGENIEGNIKEYSKYGEGIYELMDSWQIVDPWGKGLHYLSSAPEQTFSNKNNGVKPYQSYWGTENTASALKAVSFDLFPPRHNPGTFDLGSKGPDKQSVNWIKFDYRLPNAAKAEGVISIYGDISGGEFFGYKFKPSEGLKATDSDNDNITNYDKN